MEQGPLGRTIFRHNKAIAKGVQSLWLSYGVLSSPQCAAQLSLDGSGSQHISN